MLELVALDSGAAGPEPQDRFLDDEHELAIPLEQVALPADPLGDGLGDGDDSTPRSCRTSVKMPVMYAAVCSSPGTTLVW